MFASNTLTTIRKTIVTVIALLAGALAISTATSTSASAATPTSTLYGVSGYTGPTVVGFGACKHPAGSKNDKTLWLDAPGPRITGANLTRNAGDKTTVSYMVWVVDAKTNRVLDSSRQTPWFRLDESQYVPYSGSTRFYPSLTSNTRLIYEFAWANASATTILGRAYRVVTSYSYRDQFDRLLGYYGSCWKASQSVRFSASSSDTSTTSTTPTTTSVAPNLPGGGIQLPKGKVKFSKGKAAPLR